MSRQATARRAHAPVVQRSAVPRGPRRISGPAAPARREPPVSAAAARVGVRPAVLPEPGRGTFVGDLLRTGVGRVTGGATTLSRPVTPAFPRRVSTGGEAVRRRPDHGFLDTLLRSRAWIWLIGVLLGGIVAMQVSLLKLNHGISRAVTAAATLQTQNADLEAKVSRLSSQDRIRATAERTGMVLPDAGRIGFLTLRDGDVERALRRMQAPSEAAVALMRSGGYVPPGTLTAPGEVAAAPAAQTTPPTQTAPTQTTPTQTTPTQTAAAPASSQPAAATPIPQQPAPAPTQSPPSQPAPGAAAGGTPAAPGEG